MWINALEKTLNSYVLCNVSERANIPGPVLPPPPDMGHYNFLINTYIYTLTNTSIKSKINPNNINYYVT